MHETSLIPAVWQIPTYFHQRLGNRAGRQRAMIQDGHLLLVLHEVSKRSDRQRQARLFYRPPDGAWLSTEDGSGQVALEKHLAEFEHQIDEIDTREDNAQTADEYFQLLEEILPIRRTTANLHATLDEARKQLPLVRELINFRDQAYDINRSAELLYETINSGANLASTRRAEEQAKHSRSMAESAHRLNSLVAFFFPLATLSGLFGMSFNSGLEQIGGTLPFYGICLAGLLMGFLLLVLMLHRPQS